MNDKQVLAHSKSGYLAQCSCCGSFQLCFGTTCLELDAKELSEFSNFIDDEFGYFVKNSCHDRKCVHLPTFNDNTYFVLTVNELKKLKNLLNQGFFMLEVYNLLNHSN